MTAPLTHLKLYVNPAWRRAGLHSPLMFPFWGNPTQEVSLFAKQMFDSYPFDTRRCTITEDIQRADMVFPPYRHNWLLLHDKALLDECVRTARAAGLPLLIDGVGDVETPLTIENAYILRIGGYRFVPERGRIQLPPPSDDLLERVCGGRLEVRIKREGEKPVVGFAGWARLSPRQRARTFIKELPITLGGVFDARRRAMHKGVLWRARAVRILERSPLIATNFKLRGSFSGSAKTAQGSMAQLRQELVDIVCGSDYGLDVRGDANDSTRLFEILSLGRIPVILDTERNFPFSDVLDYDAFSVRVDFRDLGRLPERIAEFHRAVTPERFEAMQRAAREAFVRNFRIDAQMPHIIRQLNQLRVK